MLDTFEWEDTKRQADSATISGVFLGLVGFEWTSATFGHINIFNTSDYTGRDSTPTVDSLYRWMATQANAIGQFNHPWPSAFNSFSYNTTADTLMVLYEMQTREQANWYYIPLDSGWRDGIAANQDNHFPDWGMGNRLTGIWADSLTKSSIISAIKDMRTFGTSDRNFQLWFKANNFWMGSTIPNGNIDFDVFAYDPDSSDFIQRIDIITNNNTIVDSLILGNTNYDEWKTTLSANPNSRRYFYVRVIENDSDYVLSSPIWIESSAIEADFGKSPKRNSLEFYPNPFTSFINFSFAPSFLEDLSGIKIYAVTGERIKSFSPHPSIRWDGRDDMGNEVPPGVYFINLEKRSQKICRKVLRLSKR